MTITSAIQMADLTRPNELEAQLKRRWLLALDLELLLQIARTHGGETPEKPACPEGEDPGERLLVEFPYDELYVQYLVMRIDLENGELERYNNDLLLFRRSLNAWAAQYNRLHPTVGVEALRF